MLLIFQPDELNGIARRIRLALALKETANMCFFIIEFHGRFLPNMLDLTGHRRAMKENRNLNWLIVLVLDKLPVRIELFIFVSVIGFAIQLPDEDSWH